MKDIKNFVDRLMAISDNQIIKVVKAKIIDKN